MDVRAEVSGGGGGGGAGGDVADEWREQHSLSRDRNRLLRSMLEQQEEGDYDRASRSAGGLLGGGGALLGAGALLGVGALSSVLSNFSWPSLPEFTWPELPGLEPPPEPDWHPLTVAEPDLTLDSDSQPGGTSSPGGTPAPPDDIQQAQGAPPQAAPTASPAASTEGIADEVGSSTLGKLILGGGAAAAGFELSRRFGSSALSRGGSAASGGAFLTPESVGVTDPDALNQRRQAINQRTPDWANLPEISENKFSGSVFSAEGRQAQGKALQDAASRIEEAISTFVDGNTTDDDNPQQRNDIRVESNVSVDGATKREVEQAAEDAKREALREFNREISGGRVR